jgi:hypothetical protein
MKLIVPALNKGNKMKRSILAITLLLSVTAQAEAIMWCMNTEGGKIVLTDEKCNNRSGNIAYILSATSETTMGCWTSDSVAVHVLWANKYLRSYDYTGWTIVKKDSGSTM